MSRRPLKKGEITKTAAFCLSQTDFIALQHIANDECSNMSEAVRMVIREAAVSRGILKKRTRVNVTREPETVYELVDA